MPKLRGKQQLFVDEYIIDLNATQAAIRAKYSERTAKEIGFENLTKPHIAEAIQNAMAQRSKRTEITADYVLKRHVEIDEMDVLDILDDDGNIKKIRDWPLCWRRTISGLDVQEIMVADTATVMKKIKWPDKIRNLELLGKHVDVQAYTDNKKVTGEVTVTNLVAEISKRNAENRTVLPKMTKK
jgi:phage terminase small subunit